jgi:hypothetical protein
MIFVEKEDSFLKGFDIGLKEKLSLDTLKDIPFTEILFVTSFPNSDTIYVAYLSSLNPRDKFLILLEAASPLGKLKIPVIITELFFGLSNII